MKYFIDKVYKIKRESKLLHLHLMFVFIIFFIISIIPNSLYAFDSENCLMCHRYRGLARVDKDGNYRLFYVDETLYNQGPHSRVSCTGCHADIDKIPHDDAEPVDRARRRAEQAFSQELLGPAGPGSRARGSGVGVGPIDEGCRREDCGADFERGRRQRRVRGGTRRQSRVRKGGRRVGEREVDRLRLWTRIPWARPGRGGLRHRSELG